MRRGVANGVKRTAAMDSRREVAGPRRSSQNRSIGERRVPPTSDRRRAVLSVGTPRTQGGPRRVAQRKAWTQTEPDGGTTQSRDHAAAHRSRRAQRRDTATEKGALALTSHRRYAAPEKQMLLHTIQHAQAISNDSVRNTLRTARHLTRDLLSVDGARGGRAPGG